MIPNCDLELEDSTHTHPKNPHNPLASCCITLPSLVTKCSAIRKISSRQTFTDISNLHSDLDLECSNPILSQDTPAYVAVLSKASLVTNSLQNIVEIVIF